jgi:hypothetical protein
MGKLPVQDEMIIFAFSPIIAQAHQLDQMLG